ncbi:MAG TPA: hypothetical protein HA362_03130 [Nanoarchaeota archaeon]|nr:hypothetical protein [Nanoarchaeota archaeon]
MAKVDNFKEFVYIDPQKKMILLKALGYDLDARGFVVDNTRRRVICKYTRRPVHFNEASILPGSTVIINTNPVSLSSYIEEYLEN